MKEGGTFQQIVNTFTGESQVCEDQSGEPLDMNQCFSAFLFLVAGGCLGLVFLLYVNDFWIYFLLSAFQRLKLLYTEFECLYTIH